MGIRRCLIGSGIALTATYLSLLGGCGAQPGDLLNLANSAWPAVWSPGDGQNDTTSQATDTPEAPAPSDDTGDSAAGQFFSVVSGVQKVRVFVEAGDDQTAEGGTTVQLDGAAVHTGVELDLVYRWEQSSGPVVAFDDPSLLRPSFVAPTPEADATLQFTLTVSSGDSAARDSVDVTVYGTGLISGDPNDTAILPPVDIVPPPEDPEIVPPPYEPPVVYAADWGFDAADSTQAIQSAINSGARTVVIQNVGADWLVQPIFLAGDQTIVFEPGVVVAAKPGAFHGMTDSLFKAWDGVGNITLYGYGATLRMRKQDYLSPDYAASQWRHCLDFEGCENVTVLGLRCEGAGGDGLYIANSGTVAGERIPCRNVLIRDCTFDNNYRQGISIASAQNVRITNCVLSNTSGQPPQAGIDLEPNSPEDQLVDIVIRDCVSQNNAGYAYMVQLKNLTAASTPVSVLLENCQAISYLYHGLAACNDNDSPPALVEFRNCTAQGGVRPGIWARWNAGPNAQVRFINCSTQNVAQWPERAAIELEITPVSGLSPAGRVQFSNCAVHDTRERPALKILDASGLPGVYDVRGNVNLYSDFPAGANLNVPAETAPGLALTWFPGP